MVARKSPPVKATAAAASKPAPKAEEKPRLRVRPRRYLVQLEAVADGGEDDVTDMVPVQFSIPAREFAEWVRDDLPRELEKLEEELNSDLDG